MKEISKFNVNKKPLFTLKKVTALNDGIMSYQDKIALDSLVAANMAGGNITNVTITGPSIDEIKPELDAINETLNVHTDKINNLDVALMYTAAYCGRVWDCSKGSPVAKTYCGSLEMLKKLPDILGLGGYLVKNDHSRKKLDPKNHRRFATGGVALLDGSMGHYQWGWNKPFYIATWKEGDLLYEAVSLQPIKGQYNYYIPVGSMSASGHATLDRETNTLVSYCNMDPKYRGGTNNAAWDEDEEKTLLGRCATYKTTAAFAEAAHKNGKGWFAGTMRMNAVVQILFRIIMGTRNSQAAFSSTKNKDGLYECGLGAGITNLFDANWNVWAAYNSNNPFLSMEELVDLGDFTGVSDTREITYKNTSNEDVTKTYSIPVFFGLKHPFGYIWRISEDEFGKSTATDDKGMVHYIRKSLYSEDYVYGTINDAVLEGGTTPTGEVWIKELSYENLEMWPIVCSNGASASAYYCDLLYYYNPAVSVLRAVFRGGNAYYGSFAGVSVVSVYDGLEDYHAHFGSPLCEFSEDFSVIPVYFE